MIQETSRAGYDSIRRELGRRQFDVLSFINLNPNCSNLEISDGLGLPINSVTGRVNELRERELIEECGRKVERTGRTVMTWRVKTNRPQGELFDDKALNHPKNMLPSAYF